MKNTTDEIKRLVDDLTALAMQRAQEWADAGVPHGHIRPRLMTVAAHSAGGILMTVAADYPEPRGFIAGATPILARQIAEAACLDLDMFVSALSTNLAKEDFRQ